MYRFDIQSICTSRVVAGRALLYARDNLPVDMANSCCTVMAGSASALGGFGIPVGGIIEHCRAIGLSGCCAMADRAVLDVAGEGAIRVVLVVDYI